MSRGIVAHGLDRLTADEPNRLKTYAREMEVMEILDGVFTVARRIARTQPTGYCAVINLSYKGRNLSAMEFKLTGE